MDRWLYRNSLMYRRWVDRQPHSNIFTTPNGEGLGFADYTRRIKSYAMALAYEAPIAALLVATNEPIYELLIDIQHYVASNLSHPILLNILSHPEAENFLPSLLTTLLSFGWFALLNGGALSIEKLRRVGEQLYHRIQVNRQVDSVLEEIKDGSVYFVLPHKIASRLGVDGRYGIVMCATRGGEPETVKIKIDPSIVGPAVARRAVGRLYDILSETGRAFDMDGFMNLVNEKLRLGGVSEELVDENTKLRQLLMDYERRLSPTQPTTAISR